ncbi:hypothetical protein PSAB6_230338 [Paraburkholderia sabiae]|nr:hypothetical protein PSAB6_230338 [Paraburkholderia sabiae]
MPWSKLHALRGGFSPEDGEAFLAAMSARMNWGKGKADGDVEKTLVIGQLRADLDGAGPAMLMQCRRRRVGGVRPFSERAQATRRCSGERALACSMSKLRLSAQPG